MEIIDEVEPVKRGVFGGAVGYLGWHGEMDMSIAIRTCVIRDKRSMYRLEQVWLRTQILNLNGMKRK